MRDSAPIPRRWAGRLQEAPILWVATVRPDRRPHLVPVWFVVYRSRLYLCIEPGSVKARNLRANPRVAVSLEDGVKPVICEGRAELLPAPAPEPVRRRFLLKYDWDIARERRYTQAVKITPQKWLGS